MPEVQCRGEEDEEGHGLQRNQRHIAINRSPEAFSTSAKFLNISRTTSKLITSNCFPMEMEKDSGMARMSS